MATAAERLAGFALDLRYEDVPAEVVDAAKLHFLDALGCGLAASALGIATQGRTAMAELGGVEAASVIGLEGGLPAPNAAFANAMLCHGLDFDDTHSASVAHVSTVTCPASLAAAEAAGASGRELIVAIVAADEIVTRIGMAASNQFHKQGFHPTAICGIFGATAATARIGGLSRADAASALGLAGSMASGIFAYLDTGSATKPLHPAWAAHGAVLAARLASLGAEGPATVLEGRFGLYHAFISAEPGSIDLESRLADLGSRWETPRIAYKPYPVCHFKHGSLGSTRQLVEAGLTADEVDEIVVSIPEAWIPVVLEPQDAKRAPRTDYEAKFSLQYSTATMIVRGKVGVSDYTDEAIADPKVLELAKKVRYEKRDFPTYPAAFPGAVRIALKDGRTLAAELPYQKGGPENPLSRDEVLEKFRGNAALALPDAQIEALGEAVLGVDAIDDLRAAFGVLSTRKLTA